MDARQARQEIASALVAAGLRPGGAVLVHSSLRSLGYVPGGPETVVQGLLEALGTQGTLLMPALSYAFVDAARPLFDVRHTPSCVGAIPEHFRTRSGTLRSVNPTHSVCGVGPAAAEMLAGHILDETPCGPHSPYRRLRDRGGQILFLGCGLRPNTSMHAVEELVVPPYLFGSVVRYRVILADGREIAMSCRRHDFSSWRQRYDRLAALLGEDGLRTGKVLAATVHIVECRVMWERALAALRQDPFAFVEPKPQP